MTTTSGPKYLTINAFRRCFFSDESRPKRAQVVKWIDEGRLAAIIIDGRYYIRDDDAACFFESATAKTFTHNNAKQAFKDREERLNAARETLARFGIWNYGKES